MCYAFRWARNRLHAHNEFRQAYTVCRSTHAGTGVCALRKPVRTVWIADEPSTRVEFYCVVNYLIVPFVLCFIIAPHIGFSFAQ